MNRTALIATALGSGLLFKRDTDLQTQDFAWVESIKAIPDQPGVIAGYASTFGNVDQGGDVVIRGAFKEALEKAKAEGRLIPMLWQHDQREPIGVWDSIEEDRKGLKVQGKLLIDDDPLAARAYAHVKAGSIGGMSIGYRTLPGGMTEDPKRRGVYQLTKLDLREVSLVTMPMNIQARITDVKSLVESGVLPTERQFEQFLREAGGFSKKRALALATACKPLLRGEPVEDGGVKLESVLFHLDKMLAPSA
jgi:HK97 family phage prohead protease